MEIAEEIYCYIKQEILNEHLVVNEKLSERIICEHFNVSRTIVRMAVNKLVNEGWLYVKPKSGTYVAPVNVEGLKESFGVRMILEPSIVSMAVPFITQSDIDNLKENCNQMKSCSDEEFRRLEVNNHLIIESRCENKLLLKMVVELQDSYLRLAMITRSGERRKESINEWEKITLAVESKNSELAKQYMIRHMMNAMDVFWKEIVKL